MIAPDIRWSETRCVARGGQFRQRGQSGFGERAYCGWWRVGATQPSKAKDEQGDTADESYLQCT